MRKFLEVEKNIKICYEKNFDSKYVILFLHGLCGNITGFDPIRSYIEDAGYATISIDLRGHGLSSRPRKIKDYELQKYCDDVEKILKKEKIKECFIVGHSFGSMIGLLLSQKKIKSIKAIYVLGLPIKIREWLRTIEKQKWFFNKFDLWLSKTSSGIVNKRFVYSFTKNLDDTNFKRHFSAGKYAGLRTWFFIGHNIINWDAKKESEKIKKKFIILVGSRDQYHPPKTYNDLKSNKHIKFELENVGHAAAIQSPIVVAKNIIKNLKYLHFKKTVFSEPKKEWVEHLKR